MKHQKYFVLGLLLSLFATTVLHAEVSVTEFEAMKKDMQEMRQKMSGMKGAEAELNAVCDKCATCAAPAGNNVTTANGNLTMGGLVQVWYTASQRDRQGLFNRAGDGIFDSNAAFDRDTFSVHTVELYFDMAITKHVNAFVYINPAAEIASNTRPVQAKRLAQISPEFDALNGPDLAGHSTASIAALQYGLRTEQPQLLQDAIINFHDIVPHHDFTVGQMLTTFNEENYAPNNQLDFVDRSYIGNSAPRDIGAIIHGTWWCNGGGGSYAGGGDTGRFQYWLGVWNSPSNLYQPHGNSQDDNSDKDFIGTILLRPLWSDCLGKLELGYSFRAGHHGGSGSSSAADAIDAPNNSIERTRTWSLGHDGWAKYYAPGVFKGLWFKGEAQWVKDRLAPHSVTDLANADFQAPIGQANPFSTFGYWGAVGYKFGDSALFGGGCSSCNSGCGNWWKQFEIDYRYESAPNVFVADPANTKQTNVYSTKVHTAGVNYYIDGHNAKIQVNYNHLDNPRGPASQPFHRLNSDSLVVNFQVSW